jgi:hypothetical protein
MAANSVSANPPAARRSWLRYLGIAAIVLVVGAICVGGGLAYLGISTSLQAEQTLHATVFTISLVEKFVDQNGRWPRSWEELAHIQNPTDSAVENNLYHWPKTSAELQQRVMIDFAADPATIASQDPMQFTAIRPIGPYYEYRDSAVPALKATIRKALKKQALDRRRQTE